MFCAFLPWREQHFLSVFLPDVTENVPKTVSGSKKTVKQKNSSPVTVISGASLYLRQAEENVSLLETKLAGLKKEFSGEKNLKILT